MSRVQCPGCRKTLRVNEQAAGRGFRCPHCSRVLSLATPVPSTSETIPGVPVGPSFPFLLPAQESGELGRLGGYRILRVLGQGGMGFVFVAEDVRLRRRVALKVMRPEAARSPNAAKRFLREAQTLARLQHDHVVTVHQVDEDNGVPFLVMPLLTGEPLDRFLEREGRVGIAVALRIARETAEGLAAVHGLGLVHRDVKPGNVWLEGAHRRVKLLDFGLAYEKDARTKLTRDGALLGTPAYTAPEQVGGSAGPRSDLFSLGCILYEMTTGQRPFDGANVMAVLACLAAVTPPAPCTFDPPVPRPLSDLIMALLAKEPEGRPASARSVADQLRVLETRSRASSAASRTAGEAHAVEQPRPRRRLFAAALALVALALVCVLPLVLILRSRGTRSDAPAETGRSTGLPTGRAQAQGEKDKPGTEKAGTAADERAGERQRDADHAAAVKAAQDALQRAQFDDAIRAANDALRLKPNDTAAADLLRVARERKAVDDEAKKAKQEYDHFLTLGKSALAARDYDDAASFPA